MGTGSVAMDLTKGLLNKGALENGNANAKWWYAEINNVSGFRVKARQGGLRLGREG